MKKRLHLSTILEVPDIDYSEEQLRDWIMANLGWNSNVEDLPESNPLRLVRLVAEDPASTNIKSV